MFTLSADGYGINGIIRRLIDDGHKPFGSSGRWTNSYIGHILAGNPAMVNVSRKAGFFARFNSSIGEWLAEVRL